MGAIDGQRARYALIGVQTAFALTLLAGAALMAQTFWRLARVDPGFSDRGVIKFEIPMSYFSYPNYADAASFWATLLDQIEQVAGVNAVGATNALPLVPLPSHYDGMIVPEGTGREDGPVRATVSFATAGFFSTLQIPVKGSTLFAGQWQGEPPVILSETLARQLFQEQDAVGRRVQYADGADSRWMRVVGVAGDIPESHVADRRRPILYVPIPEQQVVPGLVPRGLSVVVATRGSPVAVMPRVRDIVRSLNPELPLADVRTLTDIVSDAMAKTRLTMALLLVAAGGAVLVGAMGIYGTVSYTVSTRGREIGVRLALGADPRDIRLMVLKGIVSAVGGGLVVGLVAAILLSRFLESLLYGVAAWDPLSMVASVLIFFLSAMAAVYVPLRRAVRFDPAVVLQAD